MQQLLSSVYYFAYSCLPLSCLGASLVPSLDVHSSILTWYALYFDSGDILDCHLW